MCCDVGTEELWTILFRDKLCVGGGGSDQCYKVNVMKDPPGRGEY